MPVNKSNIVVVGFKALRPEIIALCCVTIPPSLLSPFVLARGRGVLIFYLFCTQSTLNQDHSIKKWNFCECFFMQRMGREGGHKGRVCEATSMLVSDSTFLLLAGKCRARFQCRNTEGAVSLRLADRCLPPDSVEPVGGEDYSRSVADVFSALLCKSGPSILLITLPSNHPSNHPSILARLDSGQLGPTAGGGGGGAHCSWADRAL